MLKQHQCSAEAPPIRLIVSRRPSTEAQNQYTGRLFESIMPPLPLHFHGPYPLCSEIGEGLACAEPGTQCGVYAWAAQQDWGRSLPDRGS